MLKKFLGAAALAALMASPVPASAARMAACSGDNLAKAESMIESTADGPGKFMAYREMTEAQNAMLDGKMAACAMHLTRAMHDGMMRQGMMQEDMK